MIKTIAIVAGEASGDLLGANLIKVLREKFPYATFEGLGGKLMLAENFHSLYKMERLSVMGLFQPIIHLPDLIRLRSGLLNHFTVKKPDLFIGIDSPDFNLGLEAKLKKLKIPVIHYVSPSVWAWRQYRIKKIKKAVDLMLTLFPFEADFYRAHAVPVKYIGHPLFEEIPISIDKIEAKIKLNLDIKKTYIALLPGSRKQEVRMMAKSFLMAAVSLYQKNNNLIFLVPCATESRYREWMKHCQEFSNNLPIKSFIGHTREVLSAADLAVVTAGTATLECMLYKTPMIITYKMSSLAFQIVKRLVNIPYIGLPNLIANKKIVPELIQDEVTPINISRCLNDYLTNPEIIKQVTVEFYQLHQKLTVPTSKLLFETINAMHNSKQR